MAWIDGAAVSVLLQTDLTADVWIDGLINHAQTLAEAEIGAQDPPSAAVQAVLAQVVARMWQAGQSAKINPAGLQSETTGPFAFSNPNAGAAGLGLTNREIKSFRRAAGMLQVGVLPTTRGDLETGPVLPASDLDDPTLTADVYAGISNVR